MHLLRNALAQVPRGQRRDGRRRDPHHLRPTGVAHVRERLGVIAGMLARQSADVESMLRDVAEDLLAIAGFPAAGPLSVALVAVALRRLGWGQLTRRTPRLCRRSPSTVAG